MSVFLLCFSAGKTCFMEGTLLGAFCIESEVFTFASKCEDSLALRLPSELADLRAGNANSRLLCKLRGESGTLSATQKRHPIGCLLHGGESEIRTHGTVLAFTRFPIVRLRPAQPSLLAT